MGGWTTSEAPRVETLTIGVKKDQQVEVGWFPKAKTIVDDANGTRNVRYFERAAAVVDGRWFAVGFYDLTTLAWDGAAWTYLVEPADAERVSFLLARCSHRRSRAWISTCLPSP